MLYRQGDVLIREVEALPEDAARREGLVLFEGEASGHVHMILEPGAAEVFEADEDLCLNVVAESATVVHDEHDPIVLQKGVYRVWQQREYNPLQSNVLVDD